MIRCPKCRAEGDNIALQEVWSGDVMEFTQNEDGSIDTDGVLLQNSDPIAVRGFCMSCAHKWRLRGIRQLTNLPGHPDHDKYTQRAKL